jgi:hypothetical protein
VSKASSWIMAVIHEMSLLLRRPSPHLNCAISLLRRFGDQKQLGDILAAGVDPICSVELRPFK